MASLSLHLDRQVVATQQLKGKKKKLTGRRVVAIKSKLCIFQPNKSVYVQGTGEVTGTGFTAGTVQIARVGVVSNAVITVWS